MFFVFFMAKRCIVCPSDCEFAPLKDLDYSSNTVHLMWMEHVQSKAESQHFNIIVSFQRQRAGVK